MVRAHMHSAQRSPAPVWPSQAAPHRQARRAADQLFEHRAGRLQRADGEHGVFALRPIEAGTVLIHQWHDPDYHQSDAWVVLSVDAIDALPPAQRGVFMRYGLDNDFGTIYGPLSGDHVTTLDNFINHSCAPNLGYDGAGNVLALRDLEPGDELFIDYGTFVVNYDEPFTCACGASACRGRVTRTDWLYLAQESGRGLAPFVLARLRAE